MTEQHFAFDDAMAADLELIVEALNGHLSPERVSEVMRRLEEDPAFRELAAPMLLTWSQPKYLERHPRPVGELEQAWNEFAEQAGITPPPVKKSWRRHPLWRVFRTMLLIIVLVPFVPFVTMALIKAVPMGVWAWIGRTPEPAVSRDDPYGRLTRVGYDTVWAQVGGTGLYVKPALGSDLRVADRRRAGMRQMVLDSGAVRFRVPPRAPSSTNAHQVEVRTPAAVVAAGESEFTVTVRGDTTDIEVHASGGAGSDFRPVQGTVTIVTGPKLSSVAKIYPVPLAAGERARLVRGEVPERYKDNP